MAIVLSLLVGRRCRHAQEQSGSIQGVIKDASGGVLPRVTVAWSCPGS